MRGRGGGDGDGWEEAEELLKTTRKEQELGLGMAGRKEGRKCVGGLGACRTHIQKGSFIN